MSFSFRGQNIVCFSTADWDTLLPTNKHQLMRRLAVRGSRVLFIETLGTRAPKLSSGVDLSRIGRRLLRGFEGARKREKRLWTVSPLVRPRWRTALDVQANRTAFRLQAGTALARFPQPIAWVYSPYACHLVDLLQPRFTVFHLVDDLSAVPGADVEAIREAEARMLARADVVFCTERSLWERARRIAPQALFLPNVADYDHFSTAGDVADTRLARLRAMKRPRFVFSGNLAPHKVDFDLLLTLARRRPDGQFILIGPEWEGGESKAYGQLSRLPNVTLLGHVPYEILPAFLHEADVLLIPYALNDATRAVFPLKHFEYLAVGKPVVATPLPSLLSYQPAITIAEGSDAWLAALDDALRSPHELQTQRRALARRHTWDKRLDEMEAEIGKCWR